MKKLRVAAIDTANVLYWCRLLTDRARQAESTGVVNRRFKSCAHNVTRVYLYIDGCSTKYYRTEPCTNHITTPNVGQMVDVDTTRAWRGNCAVEP